MNNIDQIDAYLDGTLSPEEKTAFENQLANDESLRQQLEVQKNLRAGIDRLGMKAATSATFKKMTLKNKIYKWGIATVAVTAIATTTYFMMNNTSSSNEDGPEITYELPALNEEGGTNWADADRNLPMQLFTINPNMDTVIETMGGMIFAIPAGAFLDAKDPVILEIREALTPMDIIKGGLSTTSNGELLETGGMFYLNARNGETSLKINPAKPVYANVPTNEIRPNMQLFDGERKDDGSINWVNPKPMEKQLIPVDIFSLNFYPNGFLAKVAELGFDANDWRVTDSIYYSYAGRKTEKMIEPNFDEMLVPKDSLLIRYILISHVGAVGATPRVTRSRAEADHLYEAVYKEAEGRADFKLLAEKYSDVRLNAGNSFWLSRTNNNYPELAGEVLDHGMWDQKGFHTDKGWYIVQNLTKGEASEVQMEIDPARIAAIKTEEFQNTIIATKEFEERLRTIFYKCEPGIIDLYVNNLDKKMYEIDSMVYAQYRYGEFEHFYMDHDGGVNISQSHMKELQEYFAMKQETVRLASQKMQERRTKEQRQQDSLYFKGQVDQQAANSKQWAENFTKEFNMNLNEAYRQLGIEKPTPPPANAYYSFDVNSTGWNNVDRFVFESTVNRTTLDYTDPKSGKKAVIKYEELKINITDASSYSQLTVYLVSDSLPCFMKVSSNNGQYSEKLNELMEYGLVVIGEKDGLWFSATTPKVTPGSLDVKLIGTDEATLRQTLNANFAGSVGGDFNSEITYMKETHQYNVRKEKELEQQRIDQEIMQVIFPCSYDWSPLFESETAIPVRKY